MYRAKLSVFILICITLPAIFLAACGEVNPVAPPTPTVNLSPGEAVFVEYCAACHLLEPEAVLAGPSLYGIADIAGTRVEGQDARTYLVKSIMEPDDYLIEGYDNLMPAVLAEAMTSEEVDAVVEYMLTLEGE